MWQIQRKCGRWSATLSYWFWVCWKVVAELQRIIFLFWKSSFSPFLHIKDSSCHTSPNERLLQLIEAQSEWVRQRLSYLSKRKASTTSSSVLISNLIRLLSYLSKRKASTTGMISVEGRPSISCHTSPNERLLQRWQLSALSAHFWCCHTSPNERLLQHTRGFSPEDVFLLSYLSKRKASTTLSYSMLYNSIELSHKMYLIHFQRLNSISTYFRKYIFFIISNNTFFNSTKFTTSCISTN